MQKKTKARKPEYKSKIPKIKRKKSASEKKIGRMEFLQTQAGKKAIWNINI